MSYMHEFVGGGGTLETSAMKQGFLHMTPNPAYPEGVMNRKRTMNLLFTISTPH